MGEAPGSLGGPSDDGKRLQACLKRLELQSKTKSKIRGFGGGTGKPGGGWRIFGFWGVFFQYFCGLFFVLVFVAFLSVFGSFW